MKKLLIIFIVLAAVAVSPFIVGKVAQGQFGNTVAQLNQLEGYEVAISDQQGGYLSSRYTVRVGMDLIALTQDPQLQNLDPEEQAIFDQIKNGILVDVQVQHGPVVTEPGFGLALYRAETTLADGQEIVERSEQFLNVDELFTAVESMGLFGSGTVDVTVPGFQFSDVGGRFAFDGLDLHADLSGYGKAYAVDGTIGELVVHTPEMQVTMAPANIRGAGEVAEIGGVGVGDFSLTFPRIAMTGPASVNVNNFVLAASVTEPAAEVVNIDYRFNIASLESDALPQTYSDITMHVVLENLSKTTLENYSDVIYEINLGTANPDAMFNLINDLLSTSPKFVIKNIGYSADDVVQLAVAGDFAVDNSVLTEPLSMQNVQDIVPAVLANLELRANRELVNMGLEIYSQQQSQAMVMQLGLSPDEAMEMQMQQMDQWQSMLNDAMAQGMIIDEGGVLLLKANFAGGNLTVNDQQVQL